MAPMQQTRQAKRALQRMFKVMIARINGLIVIVLAGKKAPGPLKRLRDKRTIAVWENAPINGRDTFLRRTGHFGVHLVKHPRRVNFFPDFASFL